MEPGWIHSVLELAEEIEKSQMTLFELDNVLAEASSVIKATLPFDFVAIQFFNKEDRTIQTVHATDSQEGLIGLAKHPTDGDNSILDIQALVFNANPPIIKIISGWDPHFDKLLYEQFNHAFAVRAWAPVIVLRDRDGNILCDWPRMKPWGDPIVHTKYTDSIGGLEVPRYNIDIPLLEERVTQEYGPVFIEKIGTVEAGHYRLPELMTHATAVCLADTVAQLAIAGPSKSSRSLRETRLDHVLETTTKSAMRILGGKTATLQFWYDDVRDQYVYEVSSGAIGPAFLATHPAGQTDLGRQAIKEKRPLVVPDLAAGQPSNYLQISNFPVWVLGVKTMAAFPLQVGEDYGVLYVGLEDVRGLTEYEYDVVGRFLGRAIQAIITSTYHRNALDENRRLTNLHSIAQSLVSHQTDVSLLYKIAGNALNLLAADVVTLHEYDAGTKLFLGAALAGHCLDPTVHTVVNQHLSAHYVIQQKYRGIFDQDIKRQHDLPDDVKSLSFSEGFVRRICIVLEYSNEVFGVMFVYYRRGYEWSPQDRKAAEILAAHAAIAMRIKRFHRNIEDSFRDLSSGIGHDFNRQISRLASILSLLRNRMNRTPYVAEMFWNSDAGDLLSEVVHVKNDIARFGIAFQEFGKPVSLARTPMDLNLVVEKQISRFQWELSSGMQSERAPGAPVWRQAGGAAARFFEISAQRERIKVDCKTCSEPLLVEMDQTYIERAIDAIMNNAIQALSENKTDKILDPPYILAETRSETDSAGRSSAVVCITDNGPGVEKGRKEDIFRLFYTTRVNEGGNGIGLANARRYIELHEGTLQEVGQCGVGAQFVLRLPVFKRPL